MSSRSPRLLNVTVFIILEVVSFYLLVSGEQTRQTWVETMFTELKGGLWSGPEKLIRYLSLREENDRLAGENAGLLDALLAGREEDDAADGWKRMRSNYSILPACIVTMTTGSQHNYLIVDKGSLDGVESNDGVITTEGVVGIVSNVSLHYSYAISFANQGMTVSAKIGKGVPGSMQWSGTKSHESIISGIPLHTGVASGDTVYTSGFSSIFPPGIPLGVIKGDMINNGSSADYNVQLFNDFHRIEHVFIVKNLDKDEIIQLTENGR